MGTEARSSIADPMKLHHLTYLAITASLTSFASCGESSSAVQDAAPTPQDALAETAVTVPLAGFPTDRSKLAFAYFDARGAWQMLPTPAADQASFTVQGPTFALAIGCNEDFFAVTVDVAHRTVTETQAAMKAPLLCALPADGVVTAVSGNLTSVEKTSNTLAMGKAAKTISFGAGETSKPYSLNVPIGKVDVFGAIVNDNGFPATVMVERDFVVGATAITNKNVSMGSVAPVVVAQPGATISSLSTTIITANSSSPDFDIVDAPYAFVGLPAALARPTDIYAQTATNDDAVGDGDVTMHKLAATPTAFTFEANRMTAPVQNGAQFTVAPLADSGVEHSGIVVGRNSKSDIYIEIVTFSPAYLATTKVWPKTAFAGLSAWPEKLRPDPTKTLGYTFSATLATGTPGMVGYTTVKHSNVAIAANARLAPGAMRALRHDLRAVEKLLPLRAR